MKTTYKVMAATGFRGHAKGDKFEADATDTAVRLATASGSIKPMPKPKEKEGGNE